MFTMDRSSTLHPDFTPEFALLLNVPPDRIRLPQAVRLGARAHPRATLLALKDPASVFARLSASMIPGPENAQPCASCGGPTLTERPRTLSESAFAPWTRVNALWVPPTVGGPSPPGYRLSLCGACFRAQGHRLQASPDPSWVIQAPARWMLGRQRGWIHPPPPTALCLTSAPRPRPRAPHRFSPTGPQLPMQLTIPVQSVRLPEACRRLASGLMRPPAPATPDGLKPIHVRAHAGTQRWELTEGLTSWFQHRAAGTKRIPAVVDAVDLPMPRLWHPPVPLPDSVTPCAYCGGPAFGERPATMGLARFRHWQRTIDHWIPRALGGPNHPNNRVIACWACNQDKANRLHWEPDPRWVRTAPDRWHHARQADWITPTTWQIVTDGLAHHSTESLRA